MSNQRGDATASADKAVKRQSESSRDTEVLAASATKVAPTIDLPKPDAPSGTPGKTCDLVPQPAANAKLDQTIDVAPQRAADRGDTEVLAASATKLSPTIDLPKPGAPSGAPGKRGDFVMGPAANPKPDQTIDVAAQPAAGPGATIDAAPPAAPGQMTGEFAPAKPPVPAKQATVDFASAPPPRAGHQGRTIDLSVFDSEGSAGAGNWPTVAGYQIIGELGRGAMGVVYKARQRGLHRLVALKMILAGGHAGEQQLARFGIEAEAVARLQHPNIVQIYEVGQQDGLPYFSLEFVDGGPLDKKITGKPQPPREAAQMVETLARAMHFAHKQGIIHRDLKPANILVTKDGVPKITDFGLAKRLEEVDSSQTKSGTIMGTPSYMSPEQARGEIRTVGPLSDLYTLGVILYEFLTGRPPFQGASVMDTVTKVTRDEPVAPSRLQPNTPPDLETICLKCLQKESTKRYTDCFELAEDLRRFQAGEPILARPVGQMERLWRWCRRNPKLAAAAATIMVLLLVVSVGSTWAAFTIRAEKELAEKNEQKALTNERIAQENEQKAKDSEKIAQDQADLAVTTLGLLINKVQTQLNKQPGVRELRRDLLETAMSGLKKVTGGNAGQMHRNTGDAYLQMGRIAQEFGNSAEAYEYWQQYYDMTQPALKDNPNNERLKLEMAWACRYLGEISAEKGDKTKALGYYERALELRKELAAVPVEERLRRNEKLPEQDRITPRLSELQLSEEYQRIAVVHYYAGDSAQAEEPALQSLKIREKLAKDIARDQVGLFMTADPAMGPTAFGVAACLPGRLGQLNEMRLYLTLNYHLLGEVYFKLRNLELSRLYYQKCEDIREAKLRTDENDVERLKQLGKPRPPDYRLMADVASFHQMYGAKLLALGAPLPEVLGHVDRSLDLSRRVLELDKAVEGRQNLARALYSRGVLATRAGDPAIAAKCFGECLDIRQELADKDASSFKKQVDLLEILARSGKHERAAALAEKLRVGHEKDADFLVNAARSYAQCSSAAKNDSALERKYQELALAAVQTALAQGYKETVTLETDPDLVPIRDNPDFKKLLENATKPASSQASAK
jgi:serine/threonine-protein kinase